MEDHLAGRLANEQLKTVQDGALRDTIEQLEQIGSPVLTDGAQTKPNFVTYPHPGLRNLASDGLLIPFADGHRRQRPRLAAGPFVYSAHAVSYLKASRKYTKRPLKQAVIWCQR